MAEPHSDIDIVGSVVRLWGTGIVEALLADHTTGCNIIWADEEYASLGEGYGAYDEMHVEKVTGFRSGVVKTRTMKDAERQVDRTKRNAEVFTPSWLCNQMNNVFDDEWLGRKGSFNVEVPGGWESTREPVFFRDERGHRWQDYVDLRMLEITCGEAPFLCSRYDTTTGDYIHVEDRIGILDRKLRVVGENAADGQEWLSWAYRALEATYGYEFQGDNLLVARINVLLTFAEHMNRSLGRMPDEHEAHRAANIITWNLWQMDGLTGCVPNRQAGAAPPEPAQMSLFDLGEFATEESELAYGTPCKIYDWRARRPQTFDSLKD